MAQTELMSQIIFTVARPLNFILVYLYYAVLSAVMSCFIFLYSIVCDNVMHILKTLQSKIIILLGEEEGGNSLWENLSLDPCLWPLIQIMFLVELFKFLNIKLMLALVGASLIKFHLTFKKVIWWSIARHLISVVISWYGWQFYDICKMLTLHNYMSL